MFYTEEIACTKIALHFVVYIISDDAYKFEVHIFLKSLSLKCFLHIFHTITELNVSIYNHTFHQHTLIQYLLNK